MLVMESSRTEQLQLYYAPQGVGVVEQGSVQRYKKDFPRCLTNITDDAWCPLLPLLMIHWPEWLCLLVFRK